MDVRYCYEMRRLRVRQEGSDDKLCGMKVVRGCRAPNKGLVWLAPTGEVARGRVTAVSRDNLSRGCTRKEKVKSWKRSAAAEAMHEMIMV